MRTFIAIELPEEIKQALSSIQNRLKETEADVQWVKPQNIHLTLKFPGDINEETIEKIKDILGEIAETTPPFQMRIGSLGTFPKIDFPRVLWAGVIQGEAESKKIADRLESRLEKISIVKEKRDFSAHATLGRVRSGKNKEKLANMLNKLKNEMEILEFRVEKLTLFASKLTPQGPVYESLQEAILKSA